MPINVGDESVFSQAIIVTAAVAAVLLVGLLALLRLVSLHMPIVQVDRAAPQLIAHCIRNAADLSSDTVWGAALFVAYLDDHSFIIRKMLALYMLFCGRMYLIHSDPPLEIVLLALTFYQKRHGYGFSIQLFNFILQSTNELLQRLFHTLPQGVRSETHQCPPGGAECKRFRTLTSSGFVRKNEDLLEYIVGSPDFPKLRFEFLSATILLAEGYHSVSTAHESFFAASHALVTPGGKCAT